MAEAVLMQALAELDEKVLSHLEGERDPKRKIEDMMKQVEKFYKNGNEICFITIFSLGVVSKKVTDSMNAAIQK